MHIEGPYALFWVLYLLLMLLGTSISGVLAAIYLLIRLAMHRDDRS